MEPFFPVLIFVFIIIFFNESGLLSRAGQLGDLTIYINELDSEFILHGTPPSLPTVCDKTCASFNGLFFFPILAFPLEQRGVTPGQ